MIFLLACVPTFSETVVLSGTVYDAAYLEGQPVPGETLTTLDVNGAEVGTSTSGEDGSFKVDVPTSAPFFLEVAGDHPTTTFSGTTGVVDLDAGEGMPWIATDTWVARVREDFKNCPSAADPGGMVVGEIRVFLDGVAPWDSPVGSTATVKVTDSAGGTVLTCLLDDEGQSLEFGDVVGTTGRFAAFGMPEGPLLVGVAYTDSSGALSDNLYRGWLTADGVAPFYPIYVPSGQ